MVNYSEEKTRSPVPTTSSDLSMEPKMQQQQEQNVSFEQKDDAGRLWTRIGDVEYDVTDWIDRHPGGRNLAILAANIDSTELVLSYHLRQPAVESVLKKMPSRPAKRITKKSTGLSATFQKELQIEALKYFRENKLNPRGGTLVGVRVISLCVLGLIIMYMSLIKNYFLAAPLLGWWLATVGLAIQHDANHGALFNSSFLNTICGYGGDLIGASSIVWRHHHMVGHHIFTNDYEHDPDAIMGAPFMRFHPETKWMWYHLYQHIYYPFLSSTFMLYFIFEDISWFVSGGYKGMIFHPLSVRDQCEFWLGKVVNIGLLLVFPLMLHGWWWLASYLLMYAVFSVHLGFAFSLSHNTPELDTSAPMKKWDESIDESKLVGGWAELQIRQSCNWGADSQLANFLFGGLNQQVEHHLFPCVAHVHYPALSKIVKEKCEKRGIPYIAYGTYWENLAAMFKLLKTLGSGDDVKMQKSQ